MRKFLRNKIPSSPGNIVTDNGTIVGRHDGLDAYTIGQRQGLSVTKDRSAWYVAAKDSVHNQLIVVPSREHRLLYSRRALLEDVHWIAGEPNQLRVRLNVMIRYRQKAIPVVLSHSQSGYVLDFVRPAWAIAPGQSAVLYRGAECLGGGFFSDKPLDFTYGYSPQSN